MMNGSVADRETPQSNTFGMEFPVSPVYPLPPDSTENPGYCKTIETPDRDRGLSFTQTSKEPTSASRNQSSAHALELIKALTFADEHYFTVSGELRKNLAFVRNYKSVPELEIELFELCREYERQFAMRGLDLVSLRQMYPLVQLQEHREELRISEASSITEEIAAIVQKCPWAMLDYHWIERAIQFLNLLVIKWELIDPNNYRYRNACTVPTEPLQLHKYKMRQIWVFPLETVWLSCVATELPSRHYLPPALVNLSRVLQTHTLELLRFVASLNFKVNFKLHPEIKEYLATKSEEEVIYHTKKAKVKPECRQQALSAMGERVDHNSSMQEVLQAIGQPALERGLRHKVVEYKPSKKEAKVRYERARTVGFHLLELPAVLCRCMERDFHRSNLRLKGLLVDYEHLFRVFECHMLRLVDKSMSANLTCDPPPKPSRKESCALNVTGEEILVSSTRTGHLP